MKSKADIWISLSLLAFCGFATWRTMKIRVPPEDTVAGTSFVPWLMIGGMVLLALLLLARAVLRAASEDAVQMPDRATFVRMGLFTLLMVAYAFAFMTVGYIPSTLAVFVLGLLLFKEYRIPILILFPLVMTGVIYLGFTKSLGVWLP